MKNVSIILGKSVQKISRLRGNGGSALPGLVVERTDRHFVQKVLGKLPYGVVVISGTNGKTTTTKMITELFESQGLKVFTNKTGSNFVRGVISAILKNIKISGKFDYDIAVLELDEAHAVKYSEVAPIDYALLLNVQRDQLDRFGEIDHTAAYLQKVAAAAKKTVVLNREDPRISKITAKNTAFFGLSDELIKKFPSDDDLLVSGNTKSSTKPALVKLEKLNDKATFIIGDKKYTTPLKVKGIYNAYNAAGALAIVKSVLPDSDNDKIIDALANIESAFGRGEVFKIGDTEVELLLVKNPSAFQLSLASFVDKDHDYMIAINDAIADGRDVSWLWNVDFHSLQNVKVTSGTRATDMTLRLKYDDIKTDATIEDLKQALTKFTSSSKKPKRIFATYTAMLEIRKIISGKSLL
jgi:UDP-N-acetylmuramyl tripeptide synthase